MSFPGPAPDNVYSVRLAAVGTGTALFSANEFEFFHPVRTEEQVWSQGIKIKAISGAIEFSFDGTDIHGRVAAGETVIFYDRHESAIAIRGATSTFELEVW